MRRRAAALLVVGLACAAVGATVAAFSKTTTNSGNSFSAAPTFLAFIKNVGEASCGGTSDVVTVPAGGVASGDTLIVRVGLHDRGSLNGFTPTASDSRGNTYQLDVDNIQGRVRTVMFSAYVGTALAPGDTITVTHPSIDSNSMAVSEFRGVDATGRVDQTNSNGANSANPTATITTTHADDLIVGSVAHEDFDSVTQPGGWNPLPSISANCGVPPPFTHSSLYGAYRIVSATGTYTYAPTLGSSRMWSELLASYKG